MTKLEICAIEQKSAWILRTKLHPFKLSSRSLKGLERPLLSVGFPQSSLDKFSAGLGVPKMAVGGGKILSHQPRPRL